MEAVNEDHRIDGWPRPSALDDAVHALDARIDRLEASIAEGIRTRQVSVVGDDGDERVGISTTSTSAEIIVRCQPSGSNTTAVIISAHDDTGDRAGHLEISLAQDGELVAGLSLVNGGDPQWWGQRQPS